MNKSQRKENTKHQYQIIIAEDATVEAKKAQTVRCQPIITNEHLPDSACGVFEPSRRFETKFGLVFSNALVQADTNNNLFLFVIMITLFLVCFYLFYLFRGGCVGASAKCYIVWRRVIVAISFLIKAFNCKFLLSAIRSAGSVKTLFFCYKFSIQVIY